MPHDLSPRELTWAALLSRWVEFAQAAVALPDDAEGEAWRASVPAIINLQAVTFALGEVAELPADERALGLDRAAILIRRGATDLNGAWRGEPMPERVRELIEDARAALRAAGDLATVLVADHEGLVVPAWADSIDQLITSGFSGTLWVATPGLIVARSAPIAWWRDGAADVIADAVPAATAVVARACQLYRMLDEAQRPTEDVVAPLDVSLPLGMPMLMVAIDHGDVCYDRTRDDRASDWAATQQRVMPDGARCLPLRMHEELGTPGAD
jgi:hypothetical protein